MPQQERSGGFVKSVVVFPVILNIRGLNPLNQRFEVFIQTHIQVFISLFPECPEALYRIKKFLDRLCDSYLAL